jgi:hypothetical protein
MRIRANLYAELQEEANAYRWSIRAGGGVGRDAAHGWPLGWAPVTEDMLYKVDNEESNDFTYFDDDRDASGVTDEQALLVSFESACRDQAGRQLMAAERQALSDRKAMVQRTGPRELTGETRQQSGAPRMKKITAKHIYVIVTTCHGKKEC